MNLLSLCGRIETWNFVLRFFLSCIYKKSVIFFSLANRCTKKGVFFCFNEKIEGTVIQFSKGLSLFFLITFPNSSTKEGLFLFVKARIMVDFILNFSRYASNTAIQDFSIRHLLSKESLFFIMTARQTLRLFQIRSWCQLKLKKIIMKEKCDFNPNFYPLSFPDQISSAEFYQKFPNFFEGENWHKAHWVF